MKDKNTTINGTVYLSCPVSVHINKLKEVYDKLYDHIENGYNVNVWKRNGHIYHDELLGNAKKMVLMLPNNRFECDFDLLPNGCKSELIRAIKSNKEIFIAYKKTNNEIQFYEMNMMIYENTNRVGAIAGTYHSIFSSSGKESTADEIIPNKIIPVDPSVSSVDKRVLLMLM